MTARFMSPAFACLICVVGCIFDEAPSGFVETESASYRYRNGYQVVTANVPKEELSAIKTVVLPNNATFMKASQDHISFQGNRGKDFYGVIDGTVDAAQQVDTIILLSAKNHDTMYFATTGVVSFHEVSIYFDDLKFTVPESFEVEKADLEFEGLLLEDDNPEAGRISTIPERYQSLNWQVVELFPKEQLASAKE